MSGPRSVKQSVPGAVPPTGTASGSPSVAPSVTPEELLDSADQMLTSPVPGLGSLWPRACALLIRLALELTLDRYWARVLPTAAACGMRQQLLLLPLYAGASSEADASSEAGASLGAGAADAALATLSGTASDVNSDAGSDAASLAREAWLGLAGAAHHHAYELAPTAEELRRWHTAVSRLVVLLAQPPPEQRSAVPMDAS